MIWFYFLPLPFRFALVSLVMLGGALGAAGFVVKVWRRCRAPAYIAESANEGISFAFSFFSCVMCGVFLQSLFDVPSPIILITVSPPSRKKRRIT